MSMFSAHHNYWHPWVGANWSCAAWITNVSSAMLQPESSSVAVETKKGSNVLLYQGVYLWFETLWHSWHSTFTVYNHKVRTSWDKPSTKPLHSTENELEPSRCAAMCCLILKLFLATPCDVEFYSFTVLSEWSRGLLLIFAV